MQDTIHVKGVAKLGASLDKLDNAMKKKVAKRATGAMGVIGRYYVQTEAPYRTGNLYKHIRTAQRTRGVGINQITYVVFVKTDGGRKAKAKQSRSELPYYWYMIEFGWIDKAGKHHAANPFMSRGFDKSTGPALNAARDVAKTELELAAK